MIIQLSKGLLLFFVCQNVIEKEDEEVYEYALQLLLSTVMNAIIALLISVLSKIVILYLFYLIAFIMMRKSEGSFHAKTHFGCRCIFIVVLSCFILFIKFAPDGIYFIISGISIFTSVVAISFLRH